VLIPVTVAIIFVSLIAAFGSVRAACVLMMPVPFAVASGALALCLRGMHLNVSTGVGFATLFTLFITPVIYRIFVPPLGQASGHEV
jgi:heavy metal efflux system protein